MTVEVLPTAMYINNYGTQCLTALYRILFSETHISKTLLKHACTHIQADVKLTIHWQESGNTKIRIYKNDLLICIVFYARDSFFTVIINLDLSYSYLTLGSIFDIKYSVVFHCIYINILQETVQLTVLTLNYFQYIFRYLW